MEFSVLNRIITTNIFCLLLTLASLPAIAAKLDIQVREKGTGDAVAEATVVINNNQHAMTEQTGNVSFSAVQFPLSLKVLAPGYITLEQSITQPQAILKIFIEPEQYTSETLEVTAERVIEKTSKVVLDAEELKRAPGSMGDPIKVIQNLPGVVNRGPTMMVRGSSNNENQVWVNNMRIEYLFHWMDVMGASSVINPDLAKDFNIFLGGFPVEYPDALGGFFDIQLRKPKSNRLYQTYRVGMNESALLVEGPINPSQSTSFYFAARKSYLDVLLTPELLNKITPDTLKIITIPNYYDAQASIVKQSDKETIDLQYFTAGDGIALLNNSGKELYPQSAGNFERSFSFENIGLNYTRKHSRDILISSVQEYRVRHEKTIIGSDENGEPFKESGRYWQLGWHPSVSWQQNTDQHWRFGSEFIYAAYPINIYVPNFSGQQNNNITLASKTRVIRTVKAGNYNPYIKFRRNWSAQLVTITGLRYSGIEGTDGVSLHGLMPRATIEYYMKPNVMLTASWGRYLQMPAEEYLLKDYGNPALQYTEAEHRIAGMHVQLNPLWKLQTELWQKPMRKLVASTEQAPPDNYQNAVNGNAYGVDLLLKRKSTDRKFGWLSYSYSHSERTNTLKQETSLFSGDQPHTLTMIWGQPFPAMLKNWEWGIKVQIHSGKPHTPVVNRTAYCTNAGNTIECANQAAPNEASSCDPSVEQCLYFWQPKYGDPNSQRLPIYYKIDLRIDRRIRFNNWQLSMYADIQNITAAENIMGYDYGKNFEDYANPRAVSGLSFPLPFLGLEAQF